jgi:hypothetical protein
MPISQSDLDLWFQSDPPKAFDDSGQMTQQMDIQEAALGLAEAILENTPPCADQSAAIRKVREAVMTAREAILYGDTAGA